jgi:hypothetical protein
MCRNILHPTSEPEPLTSRIIIETPDRKKSWVVDEICASAVEEFILEFMDDVRSGFKNKDEAYKLDRKLYLQKKLEVKP